jgi:hypothetical protein
MRSGEDMGLGKTWGPGKTLGSRELRSQHPLSRVERPGTSAGIGRCLSDLRRPRRGDRRGPGIRGHHGNNERTTSDCRDPDRSAPGRARAFGARAARGFDRARRPDPWRYLVRVFPYLRGERRQEVKARGRVSFASVEPLPASHSRRRPLWSVGAFTTQLLRVGEPGRLLPRPKTTKSLCKEESLCEEKVTLRSCPVHKRFTPARVILAAPIVPFTFGDHRAPARC